MLPAGVFDRTPSRQWLKNYGEKFRKKTQATKRWDDTRAKFADNTDDAFVPSFWLTSLKISKPGLHSATRLQILKC
jgi:hypothetical protein